MEIHLEILYIQKFLVIIKNISVYKLPINNLILGTYQWFQFRGQQ